MAITKVFLHLTKDQSDGMKRQVYGRLKVPLITHMCSQGPELSFVLLQHVQLLIQSNAKVFKDECVLLTACHCAVLNCVPEHISS